METAEISKMLAYDAAHFDDNHDDDQSSFPLISTSHLSSEDKPSNVPHKRLASLDVFRGLTIAVMILVDDAGGSWPGINHSPWDGVTLADFVMPFFLFIVGISIVLALKHAESMDLLNCVWKISLRALKLFILGLFLQGGYFHGVNDLGYGVDIQQIRIMGILQRISIAYFIVAVCELTTKKLVTKKSLHIFNFVPVLYRMYALHCVAVLILSSIYIGLLYGLKIPDWEFSVSTSAGSEQILKVYIIFCCTLEIIRDAYEMEWLYNRFLGLLCHIAGLYLGINYQLLFIQHPIYISSRTCCNGILIWDRVDCNVKGNLGPGCNAVGFFDRTILGINHLYQHPVYRRTKECSMNSPDYGPLPADSPSWCLAPFDPEGLLSSLMAVVSCFCGSHYGHVLVHFKNHKRRLLQWIIAGLILNVLGLSIAWFGLPLNKPLYSLSYVCVTAGVAGLLFSTLYILVDIWNCRKIFLLFEWMGMNALLIFVLAACDVFPALIQGLYWKSPDKNMVTFVELGIFQNLLNSKKWSKMAYVLFEIMFWFLVSGFLKAYGIFWKF